ncbi:MAG: GAF domain-containing protein [Desulfotignum sp.]|nr:GAF domain-containing protein [Desulfotignum sp.]
MTKRVNITGLEKPKIEDIVVEKWQKIIDLTARIADVPSGLIMQITDTSMQVFLKSSNTANPYQQGASDSLGHGLYCETVIGNNAELLVDNALKHEEWKENPDVKLNMISYFGLPIIWPDQDYFGTICVLDNKENAYNDTFRQLISEFKTSIEKDLELLCQTQELKNSLSQIKQLRGLLPICMHCKKIRDDKGYWNQIETYIRNHSQAEFSHSICRECAEKYYPDMDLYDNE